MPHCAGHKYLQCILFLLSSLLIVLFCLWQGKGERQILGFSPWCWQTVGVLCMVYCGAFDVWVMSACFTLHITNTPTMYWSPHIYTILNILYLPLSMVSVKCSCNCWSILDLWPGTRYCWLTRGDVDSKLAKSFYTHGWCFGNWTSDP